MNYSPSWKNLFGRNAVIIDDKNNMADIINK